MCNICISIFYTEKSENKPIKILSIFCNLLSKMGGNCQKQVNLRYKIRG